MAKTFLITVGGSDYSKGRTPAEMKLEMEVAAENKEEAIDEFLNVMKNKIISVEEI
jgi:hypothetical protein